MSGAAARLRAGFTVLELLVTLGIMAIISVAVVLTVKPRLEKTQADSLEDSWRTVEQAIRSYRRNVGRYPSDVRQLIYKPGTASPSIPSTTSCGSALTVAQRNGWRGPYIAGADAPTLIASGGDLPNVLVRVPATSTVVGRLVVRVHPIDQTVADILEERLDPAPADLSSGRVRWNADTLKFAMVIGAC